MQTVKSFFSFALFCGLLYDAVSISHYTVSNGRTIDKLESVKDLEGGSRDLVDVISWAMSGRTRKTIGNNQL